MRPRSRWAAVDGRPAPARRGALRFVLRECVLGSLIYVAALPQRDANARLVLTGLLVALLWAAWDGVVARAGGPSWIATAVEGSLLFVASMTVANQLGLLFGAPPIGW